LRNHPASAGFFVSVSLAELFLLVTIKMISLFLLVVLYVAAGVNHFIHPQFYTDIMPGYLPAHTTLVAASGIAEIILGILLIPKKTRRMAAILIAIMLVVFIPVHIFMLVQAYNIPGYQTSVTRAWIRLLLQPILIMWVLWHAEKNLLEK
jgi:uncharacterized membrane protein